MSSIRKGNELLAELEKVVTKVLTMASEPHSQGELRKFRVTVPPLIAELQRLGQELCTEQPSGVVYNDERDAIFKRLNELGVLVREHLPQDTKGLIEKLPIFSGRVAEEIRGMMSVYEEGTTSSPQAGTAQLTGYTPTVQIDPPASVSTLQEGWVRKPNNQELLESIRVALRDLLRATLGDNTASLSADDKGYLVEMLKIALHQLDPEFEYLPKGAFSRLQDWMIKRVQKTTESMADDATKDLMKKALVGLEKLAACFLGGSS